MAKAWKATIKSNSEKREAVYSRIDDSAKSVRKDEDSSPNKSRQVKAKIVRDRASRVAHKSAVGDLKSANELGDGYDMVQVDHEIESIAKDYVPAASGYNSANITGMIVKVGAEYDEIWVTDSSAPYLNATVYERVV